ncbi:MAG: LPS export ABC transporter periplasmic protein LptC [Leptospiraceae bacterium]|nr:LPS export ABC transporter periplasmic protein LptC [Leptospiraceae bacterium]
MNQAAAWCWRLCLFGLVLTACDDGFLLVAEDQLVEGANFHLKEFTRESLDMQGQRQWRAAARDAYVFMSNNQQDRIIATDFEFTEYAADGEISNQIKAEQGEINNAEKRVHMKGAIESLNSAGRRITANVLDYNMESRVFTSSELVIIDDGATHLRCSRGAIIDMNANRQICHGPTVVKQNQPNQDSAVEGLPSDFNLFE